MPGRAETVSLAPVFVTSSRGAEAADTVPFSHETLTAEAVRRAPAVTLDGALRGIPGFSLFRRTDSLVANPTTQGVSLRGLGPSGASRSLVLLDGVPLNDPFGGWVLWSKVPRESLAGIEVVPGGGGAAWGNAALGGVIQLFTNPASGRRERVMAARGSFNTWETEAEFTEPVGSAPGVVTWTYTVENSALRSLAEGAKKDDVFVIELRDGPDRVPTTVTVTLPGSQTAHR